MTEKLLNKPRAVIFDVGNTLALPDWPRIMSVSERVAALRVDEAGLQRRMCEVMVEVDRTTDFRGGGYESLRPGWEFRRLFRGLGLDESEVEDAASALAVEHEKKHLWCVPNPDAAPVLGELKGEGMRLAAISNSPDGSVEKMVRAIGVGGHLEFALDSHRVGYSKPDPRIFAEAVGRLGVEAREAVYVGDSYSQDVAGARGAGLSAVLYDPLNLQPDPEVVRIRSLRELTNTWGERTGRGR
ncbi:MAG TPA: HAD family hydrolase [Pyrinomonadaceae bacterium]|jgi:HAD superfamily hydrolase (TIGR01509 family)|nr:HAD family hydrolase [Pyrinomonadaceae bacterium]